MIEEVREWLPAEAAVQDRAQAPVRQAIGDWSRRWFARRGLNAGAPRAAQHAGPAEAAPWLLYGEAVSISCSRRCVSRLLGWALDVDFDYLPQSDVDRDLLQAFEHRMLGDLVGSVEVALGLAGGAPARPRPPALPLGRLGGALTPLLDERGDELATLAIPLEPIIELCRAPRQPAADRRTLPPLLSGLGRTSLAVRADLGQSEISLAELRTLAPGDVVVLDRPLSQGARLAIAGSGLAFANAELITEDGCYALSLLSHS